MHYYNSNRKKIRGWKRRIRQVERWGIWASKPDLDWFANRGYEYKRSTLYPFYTINKRHPPLWFYQMVISQLVIAFKAWTNTFDQLGIHYDLHLWLYDPAYIRSEIICYRVEHQGELRRLSYEAVDEKPFPYAKLENPKYDLRQFDWVLAKDEDVIFESELKYMDESEEDLLNDGYTREEQQDGKVYYAKPIGDLWIGRKKGARDAATNNEVQGYFAPPV